MSRLLLGHQRQYPDGEAADVGRTGAHEVKALFLQPVQPSRVTGRRSSLLMTYDRA